jgi:hypothetical protein
MYLRKENFSVFFRPFFFPVTIYCVLKYIEGKSSNINLIYIKVMTKKVPLTIRLLCGANINKLDSRMLSVHELRQEA